MSLTWRPTATLGTLQKRAELIERMRLFFKERGILEVETPLLSQATVTDLHIQSVPVFSPTLKAEDKLFYLQTSPEYAMKRLLAAGSGPIYQISKAFRRGEAGRLHNPEFTMLEWYRLDFDHIDLMKEMADFLQAVIGTTVVASSRYQDVFVKYLKINPHHADLDTLKSCVASQGSILDLSHENDRDVCLDLLFSHYIAPHLGTDGPLFLYDFPASQAALAKIRPGATPVASRFEVYIKGTEIANGFHELQDPHEQRQRFLNDLNKRKQKNLPDVPLDENFLAALEHGLPNCSGVAVGVDRLVMLGLGAANIQEVLSFPVERA